MAIRIDASGDYLRRTANLPTTSAFTACCWFYYVAERSDYAFFLGLEDSTSSASQYLLIGFENTNNFLVAVNSGGAVPYFGSNPATSAWHFMAIRANGTNVKGFHRTLAGTWQTVTSETAPLFTPAMLTLGNDSWSEWVNCRLAGIKVWNAALSDAEIENEAETLVPQRFENINLWVPGFPGATERLADYSGNGRNLTAGGTLTDEDHPPIAFRNAPRLFSFVAAGGSTQFATFSASATGAAAFIKVPTKIISSVTGTGTGTFVKVPTKLLSSVTGTGSAAFVKAPAKIIPTLTANGAATFTTLKVRLVTFALVTATGTASFLKMPQKVFSANATGAPTFVKSVSKIFSVSANGSAAFVKSAAKTFALVTATGSAAFVKSAFKTFATVSSGAATFTTQTIPSVVVALRHFTVTEPTTAFTSEETDTAFTASADD